MKWYIALNRRRTKIRNGRKIKENQHRINVCVCAMERQRERKSTISKKRRKMKKKEKPRTHTEEKFFNLLLFGKAWPRLNQNISFGKQFLPIQSYPFEIEKWNERE